jgi:hypothetical protein
MNLNCGYCEKKLIINQYSNYHYDCYNCNYYFVIENNNCVQYKFILKFNNLDLYCFSSSSLKMPIYTIIRQIPDMNSILHLNKFLPINLDNKKPFENVKKLLFNLLIFK